MGYKDKIKELKNENIYEINIEDLIHQMLDKLKKTPNFYIKSLTVKGDDSLLDTKLGGIDNESFKWLLEYLVTPKIRAFSLWNLVIDQDKSRLIDDALRSRKADKRKKGADLEIKITKCEIGDKFAFLSGIVDTLQTVKSISITQSKLTDKMMVPLLKVLAGIKGLSWVNLASNELTDGCLDAFMQESCSFARASSPIRFSFGSNQLDSSPAAKEAQRQKLRD